MTANITNSSSGLFLPTYVNFSDDQKQFLIQLTNLYQQMAQVINAKEIGNFENFESPTGAYFFPSSSTTSKRQEFRKCFTFTNSTLTFNHGISNLTTPTRIQGTANLAAGVFIPIPYTNIVAPSQIQVDVTTTQVIITRGATAPAIVIGLIVLEYLKN